MRAHLRQDRSASGRGRGARPFEPRSSRAVHHQSPSNPPETCVMAFAPSTVLEQRREQMFPQLTPAAGRGGKALRRHARVEFGPDEVHRQRSETVGAPAWLVLSGLHRRHAQGPVRQSRGHRPSPARHDGRRSKPARRWPVVRRGTRSAGRLRGHAVRRHAYPLAHHRPCGGGRAPDARLHPAPGRAHPGRARAP